VVLALVAARVVRWLRQRAGAGDVRFALGPAAQTAALLVIIFAGPAFSPQYLMWFAPLLAVAAGEGCLGTEVMVWLAGCALTFVEFPLLWNEMRAADPVAVAALTVRDAVLMVLLGLCLRRVYTETATSRRAPAGRCT
jgi:hypothetical protein